MADPPGPALLEDNMADYILDWNKYTDTAVRVAEEGAVLLKNDRGALPLTGGTKVALFGRMQKNYYKMELI